MKKHLLLSTLLLPMSATAAYNSAGTDYTNALVNTWSDDPSNEYVSELNFFSCMVRNARSDLTQHANGKWSALIDELACDGTVSTKKEYMDLKLSSTRASNTSPQDIVFYANTSQGVRYIGNITLKKTATELPPYGEWYFSMYKNRKSDASTVYTQSNTPAYGFTNIGPAANGNDVEITMGMQGDSDEQGSGFLKAKIVAIGGDPDTVKFFGRNKYALTSGPHSGYSEDNMTAGRTSQNYFYRATIDSSSGQVTSGVCLDRSSAWSSAWDVGLYYKNDDIAKGIKAGDAVNINQGFAFSYGSGSTGYVGDWGVWLDSDGVFEPTKETIEVTRADDSKKFDLMWSPGQMFKGDVKIAADSSLISATSSTFVCTSNSCPGVDGGDAKVTFTELGSANSTAAAFGTTQSNNFYFYTGQNPGAGYEPLTMYHDSNGDEKLDSGDSPVRFDFAIYLDQAAGYKYKDFTGGSTGRSPASDVSIQFNDFVLKSEVDDTSNNCSQNNLAGCDKYTWSVGATEWDNSYYIFDTDGGVKFDQPLRFSWAYDATKDMNSGKTLTLKVPGDMYSDSLVKKSNTNCTIDTADGNYNCLFTPADVNGQTLSVSYFGGQLSGGLETQDVTTEGWVKLVSPAAGTELTDADGVVYVVKPAVVSERFMPGGNNCANISFTNLSDLGFSMSDLPDYTDTTTYPIPSQSWYTSFTPDATACDVLHGVATCPQ